MLETELVASITQFGVAGLIGWMWMTERRAAAAREKQLGDVHERLMRERREMELIVEVVRENTRMLAGVEAGQRALVDAVERLGARIGCCVTGAGVTGAGATGAGAAGVGGDGRAA
ncbi:MAG: hypothetical protein AAF297_06020 [Planctomycetota bacterium]